jgi:hypothetical protein
MSDDVESLDARINVVLAINSLRYAGTIFTAVPHADPDSTEVEFLDQVTRFIGEFNKVLAQISETTTNMAAELQTLRSQRKAVRDFLGLTTTQGEPQ